MKTTKKPDNNSKSDNPANSKDENPNAAVIRKKEQQEDGMEEKEFEEREQISRGYVANHRDVEIGESDSKKINERISDSGTRDDDDDGQYASWQQNNAKGRGLYNRDENDEYKNRDDDFRQGDDNQHAAQKNSSKSPSSAKKSTTKK